MWARELEREGCGLADGETREERMLREFMIRIYADSIAMGISGKGESHDRVGGEEGKADRERPDGPRLEGASVARPPGQAGRWS